MVQSATFDRNGVSIDNTELKGKSVSVDCSEFIQEKLTDNTFRERLRKSRLELGLSIQEVADMCNVTKSIISVYNFDEFLHKLSLWIKENNLTKEDAANKLGISRGLFRFWFNGGVISISTYNKIKFNIYKYNLI